MDRNKEPNLYGFVLDSIQLFTLSKQEHKLGKEAAKTRDTLELIIAKHFSKPKMDNGRYDVALERLACEYIIRGEKPHDKHMDYLMAMARLDSRLIRKVEPLYDKLNNTIVKYSECRNKILKLEVAKEAYHCKKEIKKFRIK